VVFPQGEGEMLVTRNAKDFANLGVQIIDPWVAA
jgi:hypothetical protein